MMTAVVLLMALVGGGWYVAGVIAATTDLTVTVESSLTFVVTRDVFPALTPGTARFATTTLSVNTNNAAGWNVTLSGTDQSPTDTVMDLDTDASVGITDQTEWTVPALLATTTPGNAVQIGSFDNSGDVLAFRVMTASSTNGTAFIADDWWGTVDDYADNANTLWAGIASSTNASRIGNAGAGSYSASEHINSVIYYLDVPSGQQGGDYAGELTYSATPNI